MTDPNNPLQPIFNYGPSNMIILVVGQAQEQMLVHASYLTARSEFFRAAFSKSWKEGQTRVTKLPEDDTETVGQYLDYVYGDRLPTYGQRTPDQTDAMYLALARLYVFGVRVLDVAIRNTIVEHFIAFSSTINHGLPGYHYYPGSAAVDAIYEGTTAASPVRRLLVNLYVRHGEKAWLVPELPSAFFQDVARELMG
ncbi:hypothetical protein MBLNU13_g05298t1 [Cladosporium sp. NU13]